MTLLIQTVRGLMLIVPISVCLLSTCPLYADQAQYLYDDQGRLTSVIDSTGALAVYNYDSVGNLLSIDRFTPPGSGIGIYLTAPSRGSATTSVVVQGYGFSSTPANNTVKFNGVTATVNLIAQMSPIRDQGTRGTCVSFAALAAYEHALSTVGAAHDLAEQFLYWNCKSNDGYLLDIVRKTLRGIRGNRWVLCYGVRSGFFCI